MTDSESLIIVVAAFGAAYLFLNRNKVQAAAPNAPTNFFSPSSNAPGTQVPGPAPATPGSGSSTIQPPVTPAPGPGQPGFIGPVLTTPTGQGIQTPLGTIYANPDGSYPATGPYAPTTLIQGSIGTCWPHEAVANSDGTTVALPSGGSYCNFTDWGNYMLSPLYYAGVL